jgi:hypothetical protein
MKKTKEIPTKVKVGGMKLDIKLVERIPGSYMGMFERDERRIQIANKYNNQTIPNTLLHEILHACWSEYGLSENKNLDEEAVVYTLTNSIMSVMQDNKEIREYFMKQWSGN